MTTLGCTLLATLHPQPSFLLWHTTASHLRRLHSRLVLASCPWPGRWAAMPRLPRRTIRSDSCKCCRIQHWKPNYTALSISFFAALAPLEETLVVSPLEPNILGDTLTQHALAMRNFSAHPSPWSFKQPRESPPMTFQKGHFLQIQAQRPMFHDLPISVKYTKSDSRKSETNRSFGEI